MVISKDMAARMIPSHVRWIKEGRGTGRGKDWLPFLQTEDYRGFGHRTISPSTKFSRSDDVFSNIEDSLNLILQSSPLVIVCWASVIAMPFMISCTRLALPRAPIP